MIKNTSRVRRIKIAMLQSVSPAGILYIVAFRFEAQEKVI